MFSKLCSIESRRRGTTVVLVCVTIPVLVGFAALTIDVGVMYNTRADLQVAADSAALAAVSAFASDEMMRIRMGTSDEGSMPYVIGLAKRRAAHYAIQNGSFGKLHTLINPEDVIPGSLDPFVHGAVLNISPDPDEFNAIRVITRRGSGHGDSPNGPVEFFFAPLLGYRTTSLGASAVAVMDDRFAGFTPSDGAATVFPFSIHEDAFRDDFENGDDVFGFNDDTRLITHGPDGLREILLYPGDQAPGNYGLLNIGVPNLGANELSDQIEFGVSADDMLTEFNTSELTFRDEEGDAMSYDVYGNPGLKASLESALLMRVGEVVGFFLHRAVVEQGANAIYTITELRFGRVMDASLKTQAIQRGIWVQPVTYTGPGVIINPDLPSSEGIAGRIMLAR